MLSLLAKATANFLHEYNYTVYGLFSIKTNEQRVRWQESVYQRTANTMVKRKCTLGKTTI